MPDVQVSSPSNVEPEFYSYLHFSAYINTLISSIQTLAKNLQDNLIEKARALDQSKWIYGLYGALDGLSTSFSMLRYFFDVYYANGPLSSADALHDWSLTPEGIALIVLESVIFVTLATIGNLYEKDKDAETTITGSMVVVWVYLRDAMKALKNGAKGIRNAFVLAELLSIGEFLQPMVMPVSLVLGGISLFNRMLLRHIRDSRKTSKKQNTQILKSLYSFYDDKFKDVQNQDAIDNKAIWTYFYQALSEKAQEHLSMLDDQQTESTMYRLLALLAAAYNGLLDAPYLHLGVLTLVVFPPSSSIFIFVVSASIFFAAICVVTRVYEEYDYQRELKVSQLELKLQIQLRSLKALFAELKEISPDTDASTDTLSDGKIALIQTRQHDLITEIDKQWNVCNALHQELDKMSSSSWGAAILGGLKYGIDAYSSISSMMFVMATLYMMFALSCPPVLVISFVAIGLLCVSVALGYGLTSHYLSLCPEKSVDTNHKLIIASLVELKDSVNNLTKPKIKQIEEYFFTNAVTDRTPQFFFQEWFEVFRLLCSGGGKGVKAIDSVMVSQQVLDTNGHYHDSDVMLVFGCINALLYGLIYSLRGFARIGREAASVKPTPCKKDVSELTSDTVKNSEEIPPQSGSSSPTSFMNLGRFFIPILNRTASDTSLPLTRSISAPEVATSLFEISVP
jgi:hypothetical protein